MKYQKRIKYIVRSSAEGGVVIGIRWDPKSKELMLCGPARFEKFMSWAAGLFELDANKFVYGGHYYQLKINISGIEQEKFDAGLIEFRSYGCSLEKVRRIGKLCY